MWQALSSDVSNKQILLTPRYSLLTALAPPRVCTPTHGTYSVQLAQSVTDRVPNIHLINVCSRNYYLNDPAVKRNMSGGQETS